MLNFFLDSLYPWQMNFQDPASPVMEGIITYFLKYINFATYNLFVLLDGTLLFATMNFVLALPGAVFVWATFMIQASEGSSNRNTGAGTSSAPNGNGNKKPTPTQSETGEMAKGVAVATTAGLIVAKASAKEQVVVKSPTIIKVPGPAMVKSACILGGCFVFGCTIIATTWNNSTQKPIEKSGSFVASPPEPTCWDNMFYLMDHPWILVISGLEFLAYVFVVGFFINRLLTGLGLEEGIKKIVLRIACFFVTSLVIGPYRPLVMIANSPGSHLFEHLYNFLFNSPLAWSGLTWLYFITASAMYIGVIVLFRKLIQESKKN